MDLPDIDGPPAPFRLDWDYDRANADTGTPSRYGNYLRHHAESFQEIWHDDPTVEFAAVAWRVATGPIMSPPLVRTHPRIMGASLQRSDWNGGLVADVQLVSPRPHALANAKTTAGTYYRDNRLGAWDEYEGVSEQDLTRGAYLLTEVRLLWQLPAGTLPTIGAVPTDSGDIFRHAVVCLEVLVDVVNREVGPIIEQMGTG